MVDVKMKYQATIFGDIENIEPTPDTIKTVIDLFIDKGLIPTTAYELVASAGAATVVPRARLALADSNGEWTINFLSTRIDIEKRSTERHGENLGELNEFCDEAVSLFEKITSEFGKKANRIALITDFLLEEMSEGTFSTVYSKLFRTPKFYGDNPPFEWNWRVVSNHQVTLENLNETLNMITSINRGKGNLQLENEIKLLDRVRLHIDINTIPDNKEHRFGSNHTGSFYNQAVELHGVLFSEVEEFIHE